jgi:hypothetical protein
MSNMNLVLPTVSQTPGPQWASIINSDLTLIDQHDHTSNKGLPVPTAGLNINDELKFNNTTPNGLPATGLSYLGLISPQSPPAPARVFSDAAGDFYYRNTAGVDVQLTVGNNPAGTPGSISGLPFGTASASYDNSTGTFIWQKATNEAATMDSGPLRLRDGSAGSNAVTISPASGTSNYTLTLPSAAPGAQSILTVASSGISTFATVNSTLTLTSSLLKVADLGIDTAQIKNLAVSDAKLALNAVTTTKILDNNVTQAKLGPKSYNLSSAVVFDSTSSPVPVQIASMSVPITLRAGYRVRVEIQPSQSGYSWFEYVGPFWIDAEVITPSGTLNIPLSFLSSGSATTVPVGVCSFLYLPTQSGSFTFNIFWYTAGAGNLEINNARLVVYES